MSFLREKKNWMNEWNAFPIAFYSNDVRIAFSNYEPDRQQMQDMPHVKMSTTTRQASAIEIATITVSLSPNGLRETAWGGSGDGDGGWRAATVSTSIFSIRSAYKDAQ